MKILYTSDLHADEKHYQRLLELQKDKNIDCLIIGGDLIPHTHGIHNLIENHRDFIKQFLYPYMSKLKTTKPNLGIYLMMGNDDTAVNMDLLEDMEREGIINLLHKRHHILDAEIHLVGYGYVPITPFSLKDWDRFDTNKKVAAQIPKKSFLSTKHGMNQIDLYKVIGKEKTIEEDMKYLAQISNPKKTIYVMHSPPYNTALDRLFNGIPCGSKSIRNFIEKYQPYLTLHGHIHESPMISGRFMEEIGDTISINPGQRQGRLHAVIFDTTDVKGTIEYFN
ncbi:MAG: metallophosphoesterase [Pseudomonadota bacterium]